MDIIEYKTSSVEMLKCLKKTSLVLSRPLFMITLCAFFSSLLIKLLYLVWNLYFLLHLGNILIIIFLISFFIYLYYIKKISSIKFDKKIFHNYIIIIKNDVIIYKNETLNKERAFSLDIIKIYEFNSFYYVPFVKIFIPKNEYGEVLKEFFKENNTKIKSY